MSAVPGATDPHPHSLDAPRYGAMTALVDPQTRCHDSSRVHVTALQATRSGVLDQLPVDADDAARHRSTQHPTSTRRSRLADRRDRATISRCATRSDESNLRSNPAVTASRVRPTGLPRRLRAAKLFIRLPDIIVPSGRTASTQTVQFVSAISRFSSHFRFTGRSGSRPRKQPSTRFHHVVPRGRRPSEASGRGIGRHGLDGIPGLHYGDREPDQLQIRPA